MSKRYRELTFSYLQDPECIKMNSQSPFYLAKEKEMIKTAERIFSSLYPNYSEELQSDTMHEEDRKQKFKIIKIAFYRCTRQK